MFLLRLEKVLNYYMILNNIIFLIEEIKNKEDEYERIRNSSSLMNGVLQGLSGSIIMKKAAADENDYGPNEVNTSDYQLAGALALGGASALSGRFAHLAQKEEDEHPNDKYAYWRGVGKEILASSPGYAAAGAFLGYHTNHPYQDIDPDSAVHGALRGIGLATAVNAGATILNHAKNRILYGKKDAK